MADISRTQPRSSGLSASACAAEPIADSGLRSSCARTLMNRFLCRSASLRARMPFLARSARNTSMPEMNTALPVPTSSSAENGARMKNTFAQAMQSAVAIKPASQPRYHAATATAPKIQM